MSVRASLARAVEGASYGSQPHPWWVTWLGEEPSAVRNVEDLKVLGCLVSNGPTDGVDRLRADLYRIAQVQDQHERSLGVVRWEPWRRRVPVSMVITTNGRADLLERTLTRLSVLMVPDEIVLVDDGTPDDSVRQIADQFVASLPIRYVYNDNPGMTNCCHARNVALKMCSHDNIITTEPECWYVSDVIAQLLDAREQHPDTVLSAERCYHSPDETATLNLDACDVVPAWPYINMWKRDWLFEVGGWDESLPGSWGWDDSDLYQRLLHHDPPHPQYFVPGLFVHHMWHESRICPAVENEAHVRAKQFPRDVIANQGQDWGRLREFEVVA